MLSECGPHLVTPVSVAWPYVVKLLAEHDLSAPVGNADGQVVAMLSEADLTRRPEIASEKQPACRWNRPLPPLQDARLDHRTKTHEPVGNTVQYARNGLRWKRSRKAWSPRIGHNRQAATHPLASDPVVEPLTRPLTSAGSAGVPTL